ncbi:signal peptidase [Chryseobacterium sp. CBSDS_008]|uniref:signal peptidase n=1 Tax=Chryseobacterium sp. CBSDS_008 TaxID=3415265 RepID=UPI003CF7CCCA
MKTINKLYLTFFLFTAALLSAGVGPVGPGAPPNPGGVGPVGPGVPASPIDMYVHALAAIAILLVLFFSRKYVVKKI